MRTTMNINDGLFERVQRVAANERITVSEFLERAAEMALKKLEEPPHAPPFVLITSGGDGLCPGVSLHKTSALLDELELHDKMLDLKR
jgi:hypothetical protein